jgi:hypothetical protein
MKTWGSEGITPPFLVLALIEASGQLHALAALSPEKSRRYPLYRRLGGPHSRSARCGEEIALIPPPGIEPLSSIP